MVFENHRKNLIQYCERSELLAFYILSGPKVHWKCQKWYNLASFWKAEVWGQAVLPNWSILIWQKLVENSNETCWLVFKLCALWSYEIFFCKTAVWGQTVLPDRSIVIPKKLDEKCQIKVSKIGRVLEIPN